MQLDNQTELITDINELWLPETKEEGGTLHGETIVHSPFGWYVYVVSKDDGFFTINHLEKVLIRKVSPELAEELDKIIKREKEKMNAIKLDDVCNDILDEEQNKPVHLALEEAREGLISLSDAYIDSLKGVEQTLIKSMQEALKAGADPEKGVSIKTIADPRVEHAENAVRELNEKIADLEAKGLHVYEEDLLDVSTSQD